MDRFFTPLFCISFVLLVILILTSCKSSIEERNAIFGNAADPDLPFTPELRVETAVLSERSSTMAPTFPAGPPVELPDPQPFFVWTVEMPGEIFDVLLENAGQNFFGKKYLQGIASLNAMLEYRLTPEQRSWVVYFRGAMYDLMGQVNLALDDYLEAVDLGIDDPELLNQICWCYAITNRPDKALPYSEKAVESEATSQYLDSRGLTYTQLGRYPEAVKDFETAIRLDGFPTDAMKATRREWVKALKAGTNPITAEVLAAERVEVMPVDQVTYYEGAPTLSYLRKVYEHMYGYFFQETTIAGLSLLKGILRQGGCVSEIVLVGEGAQSPVTSAEAAIYGCSPEEGVNLAIDFIYAFARDQQDSARIFAWSNVDWTGILKGHKTASTWTQTYGPFDFRLYRRDTSSKTTYIVEAVPTG